MNADELRAIQAPLKDRYRGAPETAQITLRARGRVGEGVTCRIETGKALAVAGLHPGTGGNGLSACSGDMLLEALVVGALHSGLTLLYGHVLRDNAGMVRLFQRLGGRDQYHERPEPGTRRLAIDLEAAATTLGPRRAVYAQLFP